MPVTYYPENGRYKPTKGTIYAEFIAVTPNPCRKYHVSSDLDSAERIAELVLPFLADRRIKHKVVKSRSDLVMQTNGLQAGKFITIYMHNSVVQLNQTIQELGRQLAELFKKGLVHPCGSVPKSRRYRHIFIEQPLDSKMFIYGGYECDPYE